MKTIEVKIDENHLESINKKYKSVEKLLYAVGLAISDNHLSQFVDEHYDFSSNGNKIPIRVIYEDYLRYCEKCKKERELQNYPLFRTHGRKQFINLFRLFGYKVKVSTGNVTYAFNIEYKTEEQDIDDFLEQE